MEFKEVYTTLVEYLSIYGLKVLAALAILFFGKWIAGRIRHFSEKLMHKAKMDTTLVNFIGNIIYALCIALVVTASLNKIGIETTSIAAVIAAAGLAIGLALQGSLSNLASGVMIILFRPFAVGDFIEAAGTSGNVEEVSLFTTILKTGDNKKVIVPNGSITSGTITNYSANATRRIDLTIGIGYNDNILEAKNVLLEIVKNEPRIHNDPEPIIAVGALGDSSVNLIVRTWVNKEDYWNVHWHLLETIKLTFDEKGISIPFPQRDLHIYHETESNKSAA